MNETTAGPILTTDGIPLKVSLQKSERRNKIRAILLVAPLLLFILFTFLIPIGDMLLRSVDDSYINTVFPKTFKGIPSVVKIGPAVVSFIILSLNKKGETCISPFF